MEGDACLMIGSMLGKDSIRLFGKIDAIQSGKGHNLGIVIIDECANLHAVKAVGF